MVNFGDNIIMPKLLFHPLDRRQFLRISLLGSGLLLSAGLDATAESADGRGRTFDLGLLSDPHIAASSLDSFRGFFPTENLIRAVAQVMSTPTQAVLVNGDLARLTGMLGDYEQFKRLMGPVSEKLPVLCSLGNHDDRRHFRQSIRTVIGVPQTVPEKHAVVFQDSVVDVVVLDSLNLVNDASGLLGEAQLQWLSSFLMLPSTRPAVIFVHHSLGEGKGHLLDSGRLFQTLEGHPHVKAVFHGHSHVWKVSRRGRLWVVNLPSVGYNFSNDQPVGWVNARFTRTGVTLKLHVLAGNREQDGARESLPWLS